MDELDKNREKFFFSLIKMKRSSVDGLIEWIRELCEAAVAVIDGSALFPEVRQVDYYTSQLIWENNKF